MSTLHFKGKVFVQNHHLAVPHHELVAVKAKGLSPKPALHDNLIIEGDNLKALKALLPTHHGKVKLVYIDPPYNTGNEKWAYNDAVNSPMMQEWLGKTVDRDDLTRHEKWCCMMLPRLKLLKELLRDDGVIFVSIDDHEMHHLRVLMDEVFGAENFIAQLVWEKGRKNDAKLFSAGHEYMVAYARSMERLRVLKTVWREPKPGAKEIWKTYCELRAKHAGNNQKIEDALREWYRSLPDKDPSKALSRYKHIDQHGPWRDRDISWPGGDGPRYDVIHPTTKKPCRVPEPGWRFSTKEKMDEQIRLGLVVFRDDHTEPPFRKAHLIPVAEELDDDSESNGLDPENGEETSVGMQVMGTYIYKQSQVAVKYLRDLMGKRAFSNPKDYEVIARIIRYCTSPGDVVLDSFAGSGTTAHAILALNKEDGGDRRFVLIECEDYVDELTAERVRRVIKGVPKAKNETLRTGLGGTFSYFKLGRPLEIQAILEGKDLPSYQALAEYIFFTATGETWDEKKMDRKKWFIGESRQYDVFLMYEPNAEKLKNLALNLDLARALPNISGKQKLVFAPTKYLDEYFLDHLRITFQQLPYQIYRAIEK